MSITSAPAEAISENSSAAEFAPEVTAALEGSAPVQVPENTEKSETESAEPKKDFLAPKFAALTKKQKEIRAAEQALKAKEAELQKRLQELEGKSSETEGKIKSFEQQFKENPLKALRDRGITMEQLIEMQMNDENPTVDMRLKRLQEELEAKTVGRVAELEKKLAEKEAKEQQEQYDKAVNGYKSELSNYVKQNAEAYELIAANNATDLMFEVAEQFYKETNTVPDIKQVADAVEQHLEEEARRIFELKKFKQASQPKPQTQKQTAPTLSNAAAASAPSNGSKRLSNEESMREAAKLIKWES